MGNTKEETTLRVRMFGGFSARVNDELIPMEKHPSAKFLQLFQILLIHHKEKISKTVLVQELYGREDIENSNGTLNNTIFRLRKYLDRSALPKGEYVSVQNGYVQWVGDIPMEVDVCLFEELIESARKESDPEKKTAFYHKACDLYVGEFLPQLAGEEWVIVASVHYQELYFEALRYLCDVYKDQKEYIKILKLATSAASIYPYEEWEIWRIDALIGMNRFKDAMDVYEETTKYFFEELGFPPSDNMMKRFKIMSNQIEQASGTLNDIKKGLQEQCYQPGAYFCNFPSFVDSYRVFVRIMERGGQSIFLMLCTIMDAYGEMIEDSEKRKDLAEKFEKTLKTSLRRGDICTRYNGNQYLILLTGTNQENCSIVSDRLNTNFRKNGGGRNQISYYVTSIAEMARETGPEDRKDNLW